MDPISAILAALAAGAAAAAKETASSAIKDAYVGLKSLIKKKPRGGAPRGRGRRFPRHRTGARRSLTPASSQGGGGRSRRRVAGDGESSVSHGRRRRQRQPTLHAAGQRQRAGARSGRSSECDDEFRRRPNNPEGMSGDGA
jgi:hypothetical protein